MMKFTEFQREIRRLLPDILLQFDEPMAKHTSFKIGGPVEVMAFPKRPEQLAEILKVSALLDCKPAILGSGTNILAPDEGMRGLVICLKDGFNEMERIDTLTIRIGAGVSMTKAATFAANLGLGGMEFAHGIPGSVGGGVYMNAGAYGGEISQICKLVEVMDFSGNIRRISGDEMRFSYRHSCLETAPGIVISAEFALHLKQQEEIRNLMQELIQRRRNSQPLEYPSAGSAFKRPVGGYAAALIDQASLKGYQVGGAGVSNKHAGFVVNLGGATASDVLAVLKHVEDKVYEMSGIRLEPEIRIW